VETVLWGEAGMTCRYCTRTRCRERTCSHPDVCAQCHSYLWCAGKPPANMHARLLSVLEMGRRIQEGAA